MAKFRIDHIQKVAREVSRRGRYPLRNADDLVEALGGRGATVSFEGRERGVEEASQIPDEVFPIENEEDLVSTLATLRARGGDEPEGMPRGEALKNLPAEAGQPPHIPESERLPRGKAGAKGWR